MIISFEKIINCKLLHGKNYNYYDVTIDSNYCHMCNKACQYVTKCNRCKKNMCCYDREGTAFKVDKKDNLLYKHCSRNCMFCGAFLCIKCMGLSDIHICKRCKLLDQNTVFKDPHYIIKTRKNTIQYLGRIVKYEFFEIGYFNGEMKKITTLSGKSLHKQIEYRLGEPHPNPYLTEWMQTDLSMMYIRPLYAIFYICSYEDILGIYKI